MSTGGAEELWLGEVDTIEPEGDGLRLADIFGEPKIMRATIHRHNLLNHIIILIEKVRPAPGPAAGGRGKGGSRPGGIEAAASV